MLGIQMRAAYANMYTYNTHKDRHMDT